MSNTFFTNKNIFITGASTGLGLELARQLINFGAKVFGTCNNTSNIPTALSSVNSQNFELVQCSVMDTTKTQELINKIGTIDIFISNAGVYIEGKLGENKVDKIADVINANLTGAILTTKLVEENMLDNKSGLMLFVVSNAATTNKKQRSVYGASKAGLQMFVDNLQLDHQEDNIKILGFYPAGMQTELFAKTGKPRPLDKMMPIDKVTELLIFMMQNSDYYIMDKLILGKVTR
jgi:short-subunit dehydrogenase